MSDTVDTSGKVHLKKHASDLPIRKFFQSRAWKKNPALLLLLPAALWLSIFYIIPIISNLSTSLQTGDLESGYQITWNFTSFSTVFTFYRGYYLRSFSYAAIATALCLLLGFPLAYVIAFKSGKWRKVLIAFVVAPFFSSLLIRTLAWTILLGDQGAIAQFGNSIGFFQLTEKLHLTEPGKFFLNTPLAVVFGLTYNFLPFMILPLYTSLSKINRIYLEVSADLYANSFATFAKVIWPLSLPGVVSGTMLTFIPAAGDYVNSQLLGSVQSQMIGNSIQSQYLVLLNYPLAAALSTIFMVCVLVLVSAYISLNKSADLL